MPPNSTLSDVPEENRNKQQLNNDKPICVSDSFHFSSFYWKESNASLAGMNTAANNGGDNESDTTSVGLPRSRSGTIADEEDDSVCKFLLLLYCSCVAVLQCARLTNYFYLLRNLHSVGLNIDGSSGRDTPNTPDRPLLNRSMSFKVRSNRCIAVIARHVKEST